MKSRFILLLLLFSSVLLYTSCSYAYTFDDYITYCEKIVSNEITTNNVVKTGAQYVINNKTAIRNQDMSRFDSFACGRTDSYYYLVCANSMNIRVSSSYVNAEGFSTPNFCCRVNSSTISNIENNKTIIAQLGFNAFSVKADNTWGLVTGTINNYNRGFYNLYEPYTRSRIYSFK